MNRNSLFAAWMVVLCALGACELTTMNAAAEVNCKTSGPTASPPERPCGKCDTHPILPGFYWKCVGQYDPVNQECNQSSNVDGVKCDGASPDCVGELREYSTADCSGSGTPVYEGAECPRSYDDAWWWDEGDEPVCPE